MSALELHYEDDGKSFGGDYSDEKVFKILERYLQPYGDLSLDQASSDIVNMMPEDTTGLEAMLGGLVYYVSLQIPYHHPSQVKLARLFQSMAAVPKMRNFTGFQDDLSGYHGSYCDDSDPSRYFQYVNFIAFLARITDLNVFKDYGYWIWTFRAALEEEIEDDDEYDCLVSAAATWILYCGQHIFKELVQARRLPGPNPTNSDKPGPLCSKSVSELQRWKFWGLLCGKSVSELQRWQFWRKAFAMAVVRKGAGDECKQLADRAVDVMRAIEKDML